MSDSSFGSKEGCLKVSARPDGVDGDGNYKIVFKIKHKGHQSYGQSFKAKFSTDISLVEAPGDVAVSAAGDELVFRRDNQLNDNGMTDVWIKLSASTQPEVTEITDIICQTQED